MAAITITPVDVDASKSAIIERVTLGEAAAAGDTLYLDGANGWKKTDADAVGTADGFCVLLGSGVLGTSYPSGAKVDAVFFGLMTWGAGMTPGGRVYVSVTPGKGDQTAPVAQDDVPFIIGWAFSATELFVHPQTALGVAIPA